MTTIIRTATARFCTGKLLATPGVLDTIDEEELFDGFVRHMSGDWGELCDCDKQANEQALIDGTRLLSAYIDRNSVKFWIITEADRSVTTILLPAEY